MLFASMKALSTTPPPLTFALSNSNTACWLSRIVAQTRFCNSSSSPV